MMTTPDTPSPPPRLNGRHRHADEAASRQPAAHGLVGSSPAMRKVGALAARVAGTDASVLVRGPTGSGKEVVARMVHALSARRARPMVTFNCAALVDTLLESEMFGHVKGSFTGAAQAKPGLVEVAEGGTLFIDEIGEMAVGLQAKLLRVLEDGQYRRVGSAVERHADIRVVAATNADLEGLISRGRFREDLYYRLNVITLTLPPLRERRGDVPELVDYLLASRPAGGGPRHRIDPEAMEALLRHDWPGNVRELANVLERARILAEGDTITLDDLPDGLLTLRPSSEGDGRRQHGLQSPGGAWCGRCPPRRRTRPSGSAAPSL